jgi:hypothetical protein
VQSVRAVKDVFTRFRTRDRSTAPVFLVTASAV